MDKYVSDQVPYYEVWDVVLSNGAVSLPSICKLLCCSHDMVSLVHKHCAGRFTLSYLGQVGVLGTWLACHAILLRALKVQLEPATPYAESVIAAALAAASGAAPAHVVRSQSAAAAAAQEPPWVSRIAAAAGKYSPVGPLPLRILELGGFCTTGSILRALQGSPQLSVLNVEFSVGIPERQLAIAARAVATLGALQEITITQGKVPHEPLAPFWVAWLCRAKYCYCNCKGQATRQLDSAMWPVCSSFVTLCHWYEAAGPLLTGLLSPFHGTAVPTTAQLLFVTTAQLVSVRSAQAICPFPCYLIIDTR